MKRGRRDPKCRFYHEMTELEKKIFNFFQAGEGYNMITTHSCYHSRQITNKLYDYLDRNYFKK